MLDRAKLPLMAKQALDRALATMFQPGFQGELTGCNIRLYKIHTLDERGLSTGRKEYAASCQCTMRVQTTAHVSESQMDAAIQTNCPEVYKEYKTLVDQRPNDNTLR